MFMCINRGATAVMLTKNKKNMMKNYQHVNFTKKKLNIKKIVKLSLVVLYQNRGMPALLLRQTSYSAHLCMTFPISESFYDLSYIYFFYYLYSNFLFSGVPSSL